MKPEASRWSRRYQEALRRYLGARPVSSTAPAAALGRAALALGLETLDVAQIHERALMALVLPAASAVVRKKKTHRAGMFFAEVILPIEATHRSARTANARLIKANQSLHRRAAELDASVQALRKEIARRQAVEKQLRHSERASNVLLQKSRTLQEQLRHLSREVLSAQEEERRKISRELHDVIVQVLTGINLKLATLKSEASVNTSSLNRRISQTQRLVGKSVDIVHRFARELRPAVLDDLGLIPALHSFLKRFASETGLRTSLRAFAEVEELNNVKRTVLYRVAQEGLNNVARHAGASRVDVRIDRVPNGVRMEVKDNGKSFQVEQVLHGRKNSRLGLVGMRERLEMVGGSLTIESAPGHGTSLCAEVPITHTTRKGERS